MSDHPLSEDYVRQRQQLVEPFRSLLHAEFVEFFDAHLAGKRMSHQTGIEDVRNCPELYAVAAVPGSSIPVQKEHVLSCPVTTPSGKINIYVFDDEAEGHPQTTLRPLYFHLHGGGFVGGTPVMDAAMLREIARALNAVVVSVDYRLAPEFPAPTPAIDTWDAFLHVLQCQELRIDPSKVVIAGVSAGANLAAVTAIRAHSVTIPVAFQVLIVPVLSGDIFLEDGKSHRFPSWDKYGGNPILGSDRMAWFWDQYLGPLGEEKRTSMKNLWEVSPLEAQNLTGLPNAFIATAQVDILRCEGAAYAKKLSEAGVEVQYVVYQGVAHTFAGYAGISEESRRLVRDVIKALKRAIDWAQ